MLTFNFCNSSQNFPFQNLGWEEGTFLLPPHPHPPKLHFDHQFQSFDKFENLDGAFVKMWRN